MKAKLLTILAIFGGSQIAFSQTAIDSGSPSSAERGVDQIESEIPTTFVTTGGDSETIVVGDTTGLTLVQSYIDQLSSEENVSDFVISEIKAATTPADQINVIGSFILAEVPFETVATAANQEGVSIDIIIDGALAGGLTEEQIKAGLLAAGFTQAEIDAALGA